MAQQLEVRVAQQVENVFPRSAVEIVDAKHLMALGDEVVTQVRSNESGATGNQDALAGLVGNSQLTPHVKRRNIETFRAFLSDELL